MRIVVLLLVCIALIPVALNGSIGEDFSDAISLYNDGDSQSAAARFQSIVDRGYSSPELYYNLGCAYFKSGRLGKAIVNFKRAGRLAPEDEDIRINSEFVQLFQVDKIDSGAEKFFPTTVERYLSLIHPNHYFLVSLVSFMLVFCFLILKRLNLFGRIAPGLAALFLVVSLVAAISMVWVLKAKYLIDEGVITVEQTEVLSGPGREFELQFEAHEGLSFKILDLKEDYYLGLFANRLKGWVKVSDVERI